MAEEAKNKTNAIIEIVKILCIVVTPILEVKVICRIKNSHKEFNVTGG